VRGCIGACPRYTLAASGIPSALLDAALDLITVRIMQRAHGSIVDVDGMRKTAAERAESLLRQVRECKGPLMIAAENPSVSQWPAYNMTYDACGRVRTFGFQTQDGI